MESSSEKLYHSSFKEAADEDDESAAHFAYTKFAKLIKINLLDQSYNKTAQFPAFKSCIIRKDQIIIKVLKLTTFGTQKLKQITRPMKIRVGWKVNMEVSSDADLDSRDIRFKLTRIQIPASSSLQEKKNSSILSQIIVLFLYFVIICILAFLCLFGRNLWIRGFPMDL